MTGISLAYDYDWFADAINELRELVAEWGMPTRIADVGGGVGIPSLYLAGQYPETQFTVFDHAPRPLEIGRGFANEIGCDNIDFVEASYEGLSQGKEQTRYEVVFLLRGMDMRVPAPETGDVTLYIEKCPRRQPTPPKELGNAVRALSQLLTPNGIGVISILSSAWGLVNLFQACRDLGMGVDWSRTFWDLEVQNGQFVSNTDFIVVRPGMPHLGEDSYEDAQGYLASWRFRANRKEPAMLTVATADQHRSEFADARPLLTAEGVSPTDGYEELRLVQKDGVLMLLASSEGEEYGAIRSLTGVADLLELGQLYFDDWKKSEESMTVRIQEPLRSHIDFCRQHMH